MSKNGHKPDAATLIARMFGPGATYDAQGRYVVAPTVQGTQNVYATAFTAAVQLLNQGLGANKMLAAELRARAQKLNELADLVAMVDESDADADDADAEDADADDVDAEDAEGEDADGEDADADDADAEDADAEDAEAKKKGLMPPAMNASAKKPKTKKG